LLVALSLLAINPFKHKQTKLILIHNDSEVIRSRKQNAPEIEEEIRNTVQKLSSYFPKMELAHIQAVYVFYQRDLSQALEVLEREYDSLYNKPVHSDEDYDDDEDDDVDEDDSEDELENNHQPVRLQNMAKPSLSTDTVEGFEMISRLDRQVSQRQNRAKSEKRKAKQNEDDIVNYLYVNRLPN